DPPLDRFTNPNDRTRNEHVLISREVKIKAGGAVNFIISGFHEPTIYDDGTQPGDINTSLLEPGSVPPGLIADPNRRIFRGIDPRKQPIWCAPAPSGSGRARWSTVKRAPRCSVALAEAPPGLGRRSPRKDLGMNHLGQDLESLADPRTGAIEVRRAVYRIDPSLVNCVETAPLGGELNLSKFLDRPLQCEAARHEDNDLGIVVGDAAPGDL